MIIVTPSFSKNPVFKMFCVHAKTESRRFQIPCLIAIYLIYLIIVI